VKLPDRLLDRACVRSFNCLLSATVAGPLVVLRPSRWTWKLSRHRRDVARIRKPVNQHNNPTLLTCNLPPTEAFQFRHVWQQASAQAELPSYRPALVMLAGVALIAAAVIQGSELAVAVGAALVPKYRSVWRGSPN
jgi:hypothetical protein